MRDGGAEWMIFQLNIIENEVWEDRIMGGSNPDGSETCDGNIMELTRQIQQY